MWDELRRKSISNEASSVLSGLVGNADGRLENVRCADFCQHAHRKAECYSDSRFTVMTKLMSPVHVFRCLPVRVQWRQGEMYTMLVIHTLLKCIGTSLMKSVQRLAHNSLFRGSDSLKVYASKLGKRDVFVFVSHPVRGNSLLLPQAIHISFLHIPNLMMQLYFHYNGMRYMHLKWLMRVSCQLEASRTRLYNLRDRTETWSLTMKH